MRHVVSIGGGLTSTIELPLLVLERYGFDNVDFVMCALRGEHPDTWRMVEWLEERTGKQVTRLSWQPSPNIRLIKRLGKAPRYRLNAPPEQWADIWDAFEARKMMGSSMFDPCSDLLKRKLITAYIKDFYPNGCNLHIGITHDERHRLVSITQNWMKAGVIIKALLVQALRYDRRDKKQRAMDMLGWLPVLYALGFEHNNCGGFCVKAGKAHMARLLWYYRDLYLYHEEREESWRVRYGDYSILRETVDGKRVRLTLRELRHRLEEKWRGLMFPPFEDFYEAYTSACSACDAIA